MFSNYLSGGSSNYHLNNISNNNLFESYEDIIDYVINLPNDD